ncbi:MAG: hypothetical protein AB7F64_02945, partial [Gammaproteobacteria bacterium]
EQEPRDVVKAIKRVVASSLNELYEKPGMGDEFEDSIAKQRLVWLEQRLRVYNKSGGRRSVDEFRAQD